MTASPNSFGTPLPTAYLAGFLRLVGYFALLAFVAAFMPAAWIARITEELGLAKFPDAPLAFYLARHLSLMYGFVGSPWWCSPASWIATAPWLAIWPLA